MPSSNPHMDIFNDDAFSMVTMTAALDTYEFKPELIGSMNLFEDVPTATEKVSIERRGNTLSIIATTMRGEPLPEGRRTGRNLREFDTSRIAKGHTLSASEIQGIRAFGKPDELESVVDHVARYSNKLIGEVELTWENMMLGAVMGKVLDADGSIIYDWFAEWGITTPDEIDFALDTPETEVELKCRALIRHMQGKAAGAWSKGTKVVGLAGDSFFDKLTTHKSVKSTFLNTSQAQALNRAFGAAEASKFDAGNYATFEFGGILFINYRGVDDFDPEATPGTKEALGIKPTKCKFFPMGARGVFQQAFAPGESFDVVNRLGRKLYQMMITDKDRNMWARPEVYSYPLFMCTRPEMLLTAKESASG